MAKIKTAKQFRDGIDAAFETQKTRDEAKAMFPVGTGRAPCRGKRRPL